MRISHLRYAATCLPHQSPLLCPWAQKQPVRGIRMVKIPNSALLLSGLKGKNILTSAGPLDKLYQQGLWEPLHRDALLNREGVSTQMMGMVMLSDLHWMHDGGILAFENGPLHPTGLAFPNAQFLIRADAFQEAKARLQSNSPLHRIQHGRRRTVA